MSPFSHSCHRKSQCWQDNHPWEGLWCRKGNKTHHYTWQEGQVGWKPNHNVPSHILFFLGNELEPSEIHLMPSIEVSQWFTMDMLSESDCTWSERHAWYWAWDYIWWKQLHLPWLTRFWVWCKGGDRSCLGLYWKEVYCNQAGESIACNLVSWVTFTLYLNN